MKKKLFIKTIKAIQKQVAYDRKIAEHLSKAFPDALPGNLLPKNNHLQNALIEVLQESFNDNANPSWIEYFMWELDFGKKNHYLKVHFNGKDIPLSTAADLYRLLTSKDFKQANN